MKTVLSQFGCRARWIGLGIAVVWGCAASAEPWPLTVETSGGQLSVYQPMLESFQGDLLTARAALAFQQKGATNVAFGAAWIQSRTRTDSARGVVVLTEILPTRVKFAPVPGLDTADVPQRLQAAMTAQNVTFSLDDLRTRLNAMTAAREAAARLTSAPPRIVFSTTPVALVTLDGPPQLRPLTNSPLMRVVNTPFAMLFDTKTRHYWLKASSCWMEAPELQGPWDATSQVPAEVAGAFPAEALASAQAVGARDALPPQVMVTTEPAEVIATEGEPSYTPVEGNDLLYVNNTENLLFLHLATDEYFVVLSGRWYAALSLKGPWRHVAADQLPSAFARIPPGAPKSEALVFVAGTSQAQEAVLDASIPTMSTVRREASIQVSYEGQPQFQPVENAPLQYATNTADAVFLVRSRYFCCRDGVWYEAPTAVGPWFTAVAAPAEVYYLPPGHPYYNVKYVHVYSSTPETVCVGYEPGYVGCYVMGPTIVYGTGWWHPGYYGLGYCRPSPWTYGFGFSYSSWGGWGLGVGYSWGWLGVGASWGWDPHYHASWWGPCGVWRSYHCAPPPPSFYRGHSDWRGGGWAHPGPARGHAPGFASGPGWRGPGGNFHSASLYSRPSHPDGRAFAAPDRGSRSMGYSPGERPSGRGFDSRSPGAAPGGSSRFAAPGAGPGSPRSAGPGAAPGGYSRPSAPGAGPGGSPRSAGPGAAPGGYSRPSAPGASPGGSPRSAGPATAPGGYSRPSAPGASPGVSPRSAAPTAAPGGYSRPATPGAIPGGYPRSAAPSTVWRAPESPARTGGTTGYRGVPASSYSSPAPTYRAASPSPAPSYRSAAPAPSRSYQAPASPGPSSGGSSGSSSGGDRRSGPPSRR